MPGTTVATAADMRALADGLDAAGLAVRLEETCGCYYLVATAGRGGGAADLEAIVDDDGHIELRWLQRLDLPPAEVADVIARAVAAVGGPATPTART